MFHNSALCVDLVEAVGLICALSSHFSVPVHEGGKKTKAAEHAHTGLLLGDLKSNQLRSSTLNTVYGCVYLCAKLNPSLIH